MRLYTIVIIAVSMASCAAMQKTVIETMEGLDEDTKRLGNATENVANDVTESFNPAKYVKLVVAPELTKLASLEIRNLQKTSDWKNIVEVYAMGLDSYEGKITAIILNDRGTQLETVKLSVSLTNETAQLLKIQFSESLNIKRDYVLKLNM
jgi:hypothetical protein